MLGVLPNVANTSNGKRCPV